MGKESIRAWLYNESANYFIPEEEKDEEEEEEEKEEEEGASVWSTRAAILAVGGIETDGSSQLIRIRI